MNKDNFFANAESTPLELMTELKSDNQMPGISEPDISAALNHTAQPAPVTTLPPSPQPGAKQNFQSQSINAGSLISEDLAVKLFNKVLPVLLVYAFEKLYSRKMHKGVFEATPEEEKTLKPVLHAYLNSINFNVDNPANALIIVCGVIYGTKVIEVANGLPQKKEAAERAEFKANDNNMETRGRHKLTCQCEKCKAKRNK